MNFLVRLLINAVALWLATRLIDGISFDGEMIFLLVVALIFGVVNAIVKPILIFLTFPFLIVTLGLFAIVINMAVLWVTTMLTDRIEIDGFWAYVWAALIISIVTLALRIAFPDRDAD